MSNSTDRPERTRTPNSDGSERPSHHQSSNGRLQTAIKWLARKIRLVREWLNINPIAVLLLFPLIATPARFSNSQRKGVLASLIAAGVFLWTAGGLWASAMQELAAMSIRKLEATHAFQMSEGAKQQFDLVLGMILGKPMIFAVATSIFLAGCFRATWYKCFIALYYRSRGHQPVVGVHYFLVQSASRGLYMGILVYAFSFALNNWAWIEAPANWIANSSCLLIPVIITGLIQKRYFQHKAKVDRELYGSWGAELLSTTMSLVATVLLGCGLIWSLGITNSGGG